MKANEAPEKIYLPKDKGKGEIDSFNLIDIVKGFAVKRCDGKCRLATKKERMMYWAALTHITQKGE